MAGIKKNILVKLQQRGIKKHSLSQTLEYAAALWKCLVNLSLQQFKLDGVMCQKRSTIKTLD